MTAPHVPLTPFGPAVIGEEAYAAQQRVVETDVSRFGPGVLGDPEAPKESPGLNLSVAKMAEALQANPVLWDEFLEEEMKRVDGPRKGAIRVLIDAEQAKPEPRQDVLKMLEDRLTPSAP